MSHMSNSSPGSAAAVEAMKKVTQPNSCAAQPPPEANTVRPKAMTEDSSAYWVAEKTWLQRLER